MYLRNFKTDQRKATAKVNPKEWQRRLAERMTLAIQRIEAAFDPCLRFDGYTQTKKDALDCMEIQSFAAIAEWEQGWVTLIHEMKRLRRVG